MPIATTAVSGTGDHLVMEGAYGARLTGDVSAEDRLAWEALRAQLMAFAGVLEPFKALPRRGCRRRAATTGPSWRSWAWGCGCWERPVPRIPAHDPDQHLGRGAGRVDRRPAESGAGV
ncbi:MAG: hypothetical protein HZT43_07670 [Exiguobacterium profundum]|nr:MAG: hypothetical protein HZT43_07670 [Exiguobacterium profundum]